MKTVIKQNSNLIQLLFSLLIALGLGTYSYVLYYQHAVETKNNSILNDSSSNILKRLKGVYEYDQEGQKAIVHIDDINENNQLEFTFFIVNSAGEIFDKTGLAEFQSNTRAIFREMKNDCEIEFLFVDNRVNIVQKNCVEGNFSGFSGNYIKK